ncbi:hypothetical protein Tco_0386202 [Tanacetum coccineum]
MPPNKSPRTKTTPTTTTTTTTPLTDEQLKTLIAQGVANVLAERDATRSRNGKDSHDSDTGVRRQAPLARECTYPYFMKCKPLYFKGTERVVELTQWTVGHDVAYAKTWTNLKKMMTDKYYPRDEIQGDYSQHGMVLPELYLGLDLFLLLLRHEPFHVLQYLQLGFHGFGSLTLGNHSCSALDSHIHSK